MEQLMRVLARAFRIWGITCAAILAAAANAASPITIYSAAGLEVFYKEVLPEFEKKTGSRVNVVVNAAGANINRMEIEKDSPKADLFVALPPFTQSAVKAGLTVPYKSAADGVIAATRKDAGGQWVSIMDNYFCWIYNPKLTKAPTTYDDLLKPEYKGMVSYSNPVTAGDGMALIILLEKVWGEDKAFEFLAKLEEGVKFHTKGTGYLNVLVGRGEIHVANGDFQMDMDDKVHAGLAIEPIFLRPAPGAKAVTFQLPTNISLVKGGPNPAGAKELIDYFLSKDVQAKVINVFGLPVRNDMEATGENAKLVMNATKDVDVLPVDWVRILERQDAWKERWRKQVIGASGKPTEVVKP